MKKLQPEAPKFPMRINKYLAHRNNIDRRAADKLITEQRIFINGKHAKLGDKVTETDIVDYKFRGKHL